MMTARLRSAAARLLALLLLAPALVLAAPAAAQTTTVALTQALESRMDRPLTPPEAWAAATAARRHANDVRRIRDAFALRLADIVRVAPEVVAPLIPPLGRGPQSAMPDDMAPVLAELLQRPLTEEETEAVASADAERRAALAPYRTALATTLARLTDLPPDRIMPLLPELGL